jgi:hypothetical protein
LTLDNEGQREIILQALMNVPIQAVYPGLVEVFPKMQSTVEAVKAATIVEPTKDA